MTSTYPKVTLLHEISSTTLMSSTSQESDEIDMFTSRKWQLIIHVTAVVSLTVSAAVSLFTFIYALRSLGNTTVFWKRKFADRVVVYLALCDFMWRWVTCLLGTAQKLLLGMISGVAPAKSRHSHILFTSHHFH